MLKPSFALGEKLAPRTSARVLGSGLFSVIAMRAVAGHGAPRVVASTRARARAIPRARASTSASTRASTSRAGRAHAVFAVASDVPSPRRRRRGGGVARASRESDDAAAVNGVAAPATTPSVPSSSSSLSAPAGRALLLAVPLLWATYNPSVRFIYESAAPPSPAQLSAVRTLISLAPFAGALSRLLAARDEEEEDGGAGGEATADDADDAPIAADVAETAAPSLLRAGVELGVLNCVGTAAQAYGLEQTTSTRAGFLLATINVLVPVGSYLSGETVSPAVWAACALAALGVGVVSDALPVPIHWSDHDQTRAGAALDSIDPSIDSIAAAGLNAGDAYVLIAAVAYAAFTVRLGKFASAADASELAAVKTAVMGALFVAWALIEAAVAVSGGGGGGELGDVSGTLTRGVLWSPAGVGFVAAWAAVAYSALAPGALATYLQTKGQSVVPAAEAQVIFATTPVFNALVSCVFLGEAIGADVAAGGGILVLASALPAAAEWRESRDRRRP